MVPAKLSAQHRSTAGETLVGIASRFRLSSWRAVAEAPGNEHAASRDPSRALPPGTVLRIPPKARDLLQERVYHLHRVRASLDGEFRAHEAIFVRDIAEAALPEQLTEPESTGQVLRNLGVHVKGAVERARRSSEPFALINSGLAITHLHVHSDLKRYAGSDHPSGGFFWLLEPPLIEAWSNLWSVDGWVERWNGCDSVTAVDRAAKALNVIRSKVLQQVDLRLRQTLVAIGAIDREAHEAGGGSKA